MADIQWKEDNPEFGLHEISHHNDDEDSQHHNSLEFELDNIDQKIVLRGKTQISNSTGLTLWTCSQVLSGYLDDNRGLVKDKCVLELGAGMGYCSIVAHHLGAERVLATDGDVDVLENLRYNINLNVRRSAVIENPDENESCKSGDLDDYDHNRVCQTGTIACPQLVWGEGEDLQNFKQKYGTYEVILGTDLFYFSKSVDSLWETINELLAQDGLFLLGFCPHSVKINELLDKARNYGFTWTKPNICDGDEEKKDEDDYDYLSSCSFGYHIFIFSRE